MSQQQPISIKRFAENLGISERCLIRWCCAGKVIGARKHPLTKKWVVYPPAKLALDNLSPQSLRLLAGIRNGGAA